MRIALLGLGRMGTAIGGRLLEGGHEVTGWNRSAGKGEELRASGATLAPTAAEAVEGADLVVTSLSDDAAVRSVVLGDDGFLSNLGAEAGYADCSTVSPALSEELAQRVGSEQFLAMPISGAPQAVAEGAALYLAGGTDDAFGHVEPVMEALGGRCRRFPTPGQAGAAKLANNLMLLAGVAALSEAFAVGRSGGLDDDQLRELLAGNPVVPPALGNRFEGVLTGKQDPWWTTVLGAKDAGLAADLARRGKTETTLAELLRHSFRRVADMGHEDDDIVAVRWLSIPAS